MIHSLSYRSEGKYGRVVISYFADESANDSWQQVLERYLARISNVLPYVPDKAQLMFLWSFSMIRMYYISTAIEGLTAVDYDDILAKASKNNIERGVTGLLVVKGKSFAQALEGEEQDVASLFEKIKADQRHYRVVMISQTEIDERIFNSWEMGFKNLDSAEDCQEVDLSDAKFVEQPEMLDRVFRRVVELDYSA